MAALDEVLEDLDGFAWIPGIRQILDGARTLQTAVRDGQVDADTTQTVLTVLANPNGPDLPEILALLVQDLTNPKTNVALTVLPDDIRKTVQQLGETHVLETTCTALDGPNEAAGLIYEHTPAAQPVDPKEEIRWKTAARNRRSQHPYPK